MNSSENESLIVHNLQNWVDVNSVTDKCSESQYKLMKDNSQIKIYYIGEHDERNYFHMQEAEELYYVFKGELVLRCLDKSGISKDIHIMEGEIFLLPSRILHCVRRCHNLSALMVERERLPNEMDNLSWYTIDNSTTSDLSHNQTIESFKPDVTDSEVGYAVKTGSTGYKLTGSSSHTIISKSHENIMDSKPNLDVTGNSNSQNVDFYLPDNDLESEIFANDTKPGPCLHPPTNLMSMVIPENSEFSSPANSRIIPFSISGQPFVPLTALKKRSPSIISNAENYHCTPGPKMKPLAQTWFHCFNNFRDLNHALQVLKGRGAIKKIGESGEPHDTAHMTDESSRHDGSTGYPPCDDLEDFIHPPVALDLWVDRHKNEINERGCLSLFDEDDYQVKVLVYGVGEHIGRNNAADIFVWQYMGSCDFTYNDDNQKHALKKKDVLIVPRGTSYTAINQPNALTLHIVIDPRKKS